MIHTTYYEQIPPENKVVTCPYCKTAQNDYNIPIHLRSDPDWIWHNCECCGKGFGYRTIVERVYIALGVKEEIK